MDLSLGVIVNEMENIPPSTVIPVTGELLQTQKKRKLVHAVHGNKEFF